MVIKSLNNGLNHVIKLLTYYLTNTRRIIAWVPVIWNDVDYDYGSILNLLKFKLRRMKPVIYSGYCITAHEDALNIEKAILLIEHFQSDPEDEWSIHHDQFHAHDWAIDKPCANIAEHRAALHASYAREERNWKAIWKHLNKHMRSWWD